MLIRNVALILGKPEIYVYTSLFKVVIRSRLLFEKIELT